MTKHTIIPHDRDTSSSRKDDRETETGNWSQDVAQALANKVNIELSEDHWDVINFLRNRYIEQGDPESARMLLKNLNDILAIEVGIKPLENCFQKGRLHRVAV